MATIEYNDGGVPFITVTIGSGTGRSGSRRVHLLGVDESKMHALANEVIGAVSWASCQMETEGYIAGKKDAKRKVRKALGVKRKKDKKCYI